jgi:Tol biopolymer transport system component
LEETVLVSVAWDGGAAETGSWGPTISGDGRHVAFVTTSDNIVNDDFNGILDVFVRDLDQGVTIRASVNRFGGDADQRSRGPSLNYDGSHVAFASTATNLVEDDTNGVEDVFVRFLGDSPYTHRVNLSSQGDQTIDFVSRQAHISPGARYVAFASDAENLVADDTNGVIDAFSHDRWTGTTRRVSVDQSGNQADDWSNAPSISADGLLIVIRSYATNLVAGDTNGVEDIFVCRGPAMVFADGFETGDVTWWSSAVP